jgi:hypothetical protein
MVTHIFAVFVDEFSGYVWTVPLRHKNELFKVFVINFGCSCGTAV